MKIDEAIEILKIYKEKFGNIDIKISKGYEEYETPYVYHRELIIKDCSMSVFSSNKGDIVLIGEDVYGK